MNEQVRTDILNVLNNAEKIIESEDFVGLKDLSNHVIHNASIFQDKDSINIAVLIYSISKIFDRHKRVDQNIMKLLKKSKDSLTNNDLSKYEKNIKALYGEVSKTDDKLKVYIDKVISQAQIKKGSKIYEHGISLAQSAQILGISQWELMKYVGNTSINEGFEDDTKIESKIKFIKKIFNIS
ncbi:hypothetical protein GOV05_00500 [Candidatus Woesearchaeota archaeon]|nr:hypothetical protein [Candidatus Woesearchaeota archaeon]